MGTHQKPARKQIKAVKKAFANGAADKIDAEGPNSAIAKIIKRNMKGL